MAESLNQQIADRLVRRQIQAGRVERGLRREVLGQLALLEADILAALKHDDPSQFALLSRRRRAVTELMAAIGLLTGMRYTQIAHALDTAMLQLAAREAQGVEDIVNDVAEAAVMTAQPSDRQLRAGIVHGLFPSAAKPTDLSTFAADWWTRAAESLVMRISDSVTTGVALEEHLVDLTRRIRGTSDQGFQDGVMARARSDATRLLTTQTTHAVTEARMAAGDRNPQRLIAIHHSILDSHTSIVCLGRNGLRYSLPDHEPLGHSVPYLAGPPYHPSCRSTMVVVLQDGGAVARETTAQWLRRQGTAMQDEVLGPTRARMWRDGRLTPRQLLDSLSGAPLTLEELGV